MFTDILLAVCISLLGFALQVWPRLFNRYFGVDTWRFALFADYIRTNGKLPKSIPEKYIVPGSMDNPPLLPLILSKFSRKWLDANQGFISPAFDVIQSLLVFFMAYFAAGSAQTGHLAQILYLLIPVVPLEASNLSLRTLGSLVFTIAMLCVQAYALSPSLWTFLLGMAGTALLAYTHRMAMQVFFFSLISFSIWQGSGAYLLVFLVGLLFAIYAFKGLYLRYLRGHLLMIAYWMYNIKNRLAHQIRGNPTKERKHADFVRRIEGIIWRVPVLPFFAINPWTLYVFYALADGWLPGLRTESPWLAMMVQWATILFALGLIFNLKYLRFLGEGQRYLEFGATAAAVAAAAVITRLTADPGVWPLFKNLHWLIGAGCLAVILFFQVKLVLKNPDKSITAPLWDILGFLNADPEETRIACLPHGLADAVTYFLDHGKALLSDNSAGVWELQEYWPLLKRPLREIADKYAINYFLVSDKYVGLDELDLPDFEPVFTRGNYHLLKRKAAA